MTTMRKIFLILILIGVAILLNRFISPGKSQLIPGSGVATNNDFQPKPTKIKIAKIGIAANIVNLGLNSDQTLEVPKAGSDVGWFDGSPAPGALGPAVMVGHLDTVRGAAVFYNLKQLTAGDMVEVEREDGSTAVFKVDASEKYSQDNFPTDKVYGPIDHAGIRLITCSGQYSLLKGRYSDNLVVYGTLVDIKKN